MFLGNKMWLKLRNQNTPWGLNDFAPACDWLCLKIPGQSVPISTPKQWHLNVYWHGGFSLAKESKGCEATWHMIWNSAMARNAGIDFSPGNEKNTHFLWRKRHWPGLPTTTMLTHSGWNDWSGSPSWVQKESNGRRQHSAMPLIRATSSWSSIHRPHNNVKKLPCWLVFCTSCTHFYRNNMRNQC